MTESRGARLIALEASGATRLVLLAALAWLLLAAAAFAQPSFPSLSGRVVDQAGLISPEGEAALTRRLEALEAETGDQLVVVTLNSLQGYEIEEYGYQLGRAWGIGQAARDNGVLLIVAPNERKVRIEVGYGLEPVMTDAMSALIIRNAILPAFREGDFEGGIGAGVDMIAGQLTLDPAEAQARAAEAAEDMAGPKIYPMAVLGIILAVLFMFATLIGALSRAGRRYRGDGDGLTPILIWAAAEAMRGGGGSGGGGWGGGGGFSGGGGGFGGGGASGGW